jgi:lipopolysaccharide export system protein LptA
MPQAMKQYCNIFLIVFIFHLCLPSALALKEDKDQPIDISARHADFNEKTGLVVYRGRVRFKQGGLRIQADRIEVWTKDNKAVTIHAYGLPVRLHQQSDINKSEIVASAKRLDYRKTEDTLDLVGEVTLSQGRDEFKAERIHYNLKTERFSATGDPEGDGRVHAVYHPKPLSSEATTAP